MSLTRQAGRQAGRQTGKPMCWEAAHLKMSSPSGSHNANNRVEWEGGPASCNWYAVQAAGYIVTYFVLIKLHLSECCEVFPCAAI